MQSLQGLITALDATLPSGKGCDTEIISYTVYCSSAFNPWLSADIMACIFSREAKIAVINAKKVMTDTWAVKKKET